MASAPSGQRPQHVAGIRPGGGQDALELQRGEHIGIASIAQVFLHMGIEDFVTRSEDNGADVSSSVVPLQVVDGVGLAGGLAQMAIGADAAGQTAFGLGHRFFLGVADVDLGEGSSTCRGIERRHRYLALHQHTGRVHYVFGAIGPLLLASAAQVLAIQQAINGNCSFLAGELGVDHHVRPVTQSPPQTRRAARFRASADRQPAFPTSFSPRPFVRQSAATSGDWPIVAMTHVRGERSRNSEQQQGQAARWQSGAPQLHLLQTIAATPAIRPGFECLGATRNISLTPSRSASSTSR